MGAGELEDLLKQMAAIAKAVNAFSSEAVQQQAFEALVAAHGGDSPPPKHVPPPPTGDGSGRKAAKRSARKIPGPAGDGETAKKRSPARPPKMVNDLNLRPKGKPSLQDFVAARAPKSQHDKNTVVIYYLNNEIGVEKVSADHVFTAYREMKSTWKLPSNLRNSLQVTKSRTGWIDTSDMDDIKITASGSNHVEHDLKPMPKT